MISQKMLLRRAVWGDCLLSARITTVPVVLFMIFYVNMWLLQSNAPAADEICGSCGYRVSVSGNFKHLKANTSDKID
jgi:hypothetical protein